jgi:hypothetical protein
MKIACHSTTAWIRGFASGFSSPTTMDFFSRLNAPILSDP